MAGSSAGNNRSFHPLGLHYRFEMCTISTGCPHVSSRQGPKEESRQQRLKKKQVDQGHAFCIRKDSKVSDSKGESANKTDPSREEEQNKQRSLKTTKKEFSQMPHVKPILKLKPIDEVKPLPPEEAKSAHERLLERLEMYDLREHQVLGDGNCQFRALSLLLHKTEENHLIIRQEVIEQLKKDRDLYEPFKGEMDYDDYLKKMSMNSTWGDEFTLQAAADRFCVTIYVIQITNKDAICLEYCPREHTSRGGIYLTYWAQLHYNAVHPKRDS